jgi:molecular chaperone IbpA
MTFIKDVFGRDLFKDFDKLYVGFDDQYNRLSKIHDDLVKNISNYPPYNLKKTDDNKYVIEMAIAGFGRQDIEIELADNTMIVKGNAQSDDTNGDYLWRGIAARNFTRTFALDDQIEVKDAEYLNGMLRVFLERIIPEHKKPKKVDVKEKSPTSKKQLLTEDPQGRDL